MADLLCGARSLTHTRRLRAAYQNHAASLTAGLRKGPGCLALFQALVRRGARCRALPESKRPAERPPVTFSGLRDADNWMTAARVRPTRRVRGHDAPADIPLKLWKLLKMLPPLKGLSLRTLQEVTAA
jgi:hypothetical protein